MARPLLLKPRRILACQQRQIGDVLLITPALEVLRAQFPEAEMHVLTERKCVPMLENNPHVDHVWQLDKASMPTLAHEVRWYWNVARTGYDLVVNFQPTLPRLRWVVGFSGAAVRLTTTPPWYLRPLYTHTVAPSGAYAAAAKVDLLHVLDIVWQDERPRLFLTDAERRSARDILSRAGLAEDQRLITLDPTHRQDTRRWPMTSYVRLIALLAETETRLRFLPLWGPGEEDDIRTLCALAEEKGLTEHLLVPDRLLSLRESAACIEAACLHIGNCSAPRHMAVAVGTPSLTAMGSTGSEWTCPPAHGCEPDHLGAFSAMPCQPCESNSCRLRPEPPAPCLESLEPETLARMARDLLHRTHPELFPISPGTADRSFP